MVPPLRYVLCLVLFDTISLHYKCDLYAYTYHRVNLNYLIKIQQLHLQYSVLKATVNKAMYVQYVHFHCIKIFRILQCANLYGIVTYKSFDIALFMTLYSFVCYIATLFYPAIYQVTQCSNPFQIIIMVLQFNNTLVIIHYNIHI